MGNYNTRCAIVECDGKRRQFAADAYYCKYHTCKSSLCTDRKGDDSIFCSYHSRMIIGM